MTTNQCMNVEQMYKTLLSDGFVESNSPKNRMKLYKLLEQSDIKITKKPLVIIPVQKLFVDYLVADYPNGILCKLLNGFRLENYQNLKYKMDAIYIIKSMQI
nr:hypothetical protein [Mimivirus sp.]